DIGRRRQPEYRETLPDGATQRQLPITRAPARRRAAVPPGRPWLLSEVGLGLVPDLLELLALFIGHRRHPLQPLDDLGVAQDLAVHGIFRQLTVGLGVGRGRRADVGVPFHVELRA